MIISVYADGSSNGRSDSPWGSGWAIIRDGQDLVDCGCGCGCHGTNNRAELTAAIIGLRMAEAGYSQLLYQAQTIELVCDSQYVLSIAFAKNCNPQKNLDLALPLREFVRRSRWPWRGRWVRGHAGDHWNEVVDGLANRGRAEAGTHPCTCTANSR